MTRVTCNIYKIQDFKKDIFEINSDLLFELRKVQNEIENIEDVISTPKSRDFKIIFQHYASDEIKMIEDSKEVFNKDLELVIKEYEEFMDDIQKMVKDNGKNTGN